MLVRDLVQLAGHLHLALAGHLARHLPRVALHGLKLGPFIGALAVGVPRCRTSVERRLPHYGKNLTLTNCRWGCPGVACAYTVSDTGFCYVSERRSERSNERFRMLR